MKQQFVTSAYILHKDAALLIFHPKIKRWLPPGGHIEPNESPIEAVKREVKEEVGLDIEIIKDEHVVVDRWNAKSFARPFLCLIEEIPKTKDEKAHRHLDFIYLANALNPKNALSSEDHPIKWFTFEEILLLDKEKEMFWETFEVLEVIFKQKAGIV